MQIHILLEYTDQGDFTEPHCYCSAAPAKEIVGVYSDLRKANEEKERRNAAAEDDTETYYEVETHTVQ